MTTNQRAFIYARKSTNTEDRQVYSIDHQLRELRELAAREHIDVVDEFQENLTAKMPGRPIFKKMLEQMKAGKASCILAWHPDRLARNAIDGGMIMHLVDTKVIRGLRFSTFWFEPSPQGMLMLSIAFGMSKYYVDAMAEGIRRACRRRIEDGYWPKKVPLGYRFDKTQRLAILDSDRAPLIRKMFEMYSTGSYTLERLTEMMRSKDLRRPNTPMAKSTPLSRTQIHRMLSNPFYCGVMRFNGEVFEGKHPTIVSAKLFDHCQVVLAQRGRKNPIALKPFLYRGMFRCAECGGMITAESQKGHVYMRCTKRKGRCDQPFLREDEATQQVARIVQRFSIPTLAIDFMIEELKRDQRSESQDVVRDARTVSEKIAKFEDKLRRLTSIYVDGTLSADEFQKSKAKLLKDKQVLVENRRFLENHHEDRFEPAIHFLTALHKAKTMADTGDAIKQRDFLKNNGSNLAMKDRKLTVVFSGAWKSVFESRLLATRQPVGGQFGSENMSPDASCNGLWLDPNAVRTLLERIKGHFRENPVV